MFLWILIDSAQTAIAGLPPQIIGRYREFKVCVRVRFIFQRKMPPFTLEWYKAIANHGIAQDHAIFKLFLRDAQMIRMGYLAEEVEGAAHIHFFSGLHVQKREVNGTATAVAGSFQKRPHGP